MESTRRLHRKPTDWLLASQFAPYLDAFTHHLTEGRYASRTIGSYLSCLAHFARWTTRCRLNIRQIDEDAVRRFLDDHLPRCDCEKPVRVDRRDLRAALRHWLVVLRANGVIAEPPMGTTPVDEELRRFDEHMHHVRGLAPKTRSMCLRTVRRLLIEQFADQPCRHLVNQARRLTQLHRPPERAVQYPGQRRHAGRSAARLPPLSSLPW